MRRLLNDNCTYTLARVSYMRCSRSGMGGPRPKLRSPKRRSTMRRLHFHSKGARLPCGREASRSVGTCWRRPRTRGPRTRSPTISGVSTRESPPGLSTPSRVPQRPPLRPRGSEKVILPLCTKAWRTRQSCDGHAPPSSSAPRRAAPPSWSSKRAHPTIRSPRLGLWFARALFRVL